MASETSLAERLEVALLSQPEVVDEQESAADRILDAAMLRFSEVGIGSTTMSSIASEAGLSREWLYRHYANRDAVVAAVVQRELRRFIDGLAARAAINASDDVVGSLVETFVYCVEFLRDAPLVDALVGREVTLASGELRLRTGAIVATAVRSCAGYLTDLGGFDAQTATIVAETLTRLVGSTVIAPVADLDFHDPVVVRAYAERIVPAVASSAG